MKPRAPKSTAIATLAASAVLICWAAGDAAPGANRKAPTGEIKPQDMADSLHLVLAADRAVYTSHVVHRLGEQGIPAGTQWEKEKALPPPCQLFRLAAEQVQRRGAEFHYSLRALKPLNDKNTPETDVTRTALNFLANQPERPYYSRETLGGRRYFTAVYPDVADTTACLNCHRENLAGKPAKAGDVLGGMVIRVALEF